MDQLKGKISIGCDLIQAEKLSEQLIRLLPAGLDTRTVNTLRLGLREMPINSIEHGSLEVGFEQKTDEATRSDYLEFLLERQKMPQYAGRKVVVEYDITQKHVAFRISDEGRGFDHKRMRQNAHQGENNLDLAHGRGIKMTLRVFDKVRYNTRGNRVTLFKRFSVPAVSTAKGA